jgi:hypothetical protein
MVQSAWRAQRNHKARGRLLRHLPQGFPAPVLAHALSRPLIPPTPRRAVESYWRHHVVRADKLARALAAQSGQPEGWIWRVSSNSSGLPTRFRSPPAPFREPPHTRGPGYCCVCGQPVFRLGWHRDLFDDGQPNRNAIWHSCCVAAWNLWTAPSDYVRQLKMMQQRCCGVTGARLRKDAEVDHNVPLFRLWREGEHRWPALLSYWGIPNLQLVNRPAHAQKCARECEERAHLRNAARQLAAGADQGSATGSARALRLRPERMSPPPTRP